MRHQQQQRLSPGTLQINSSIHYIYFLPKYFFYLAARNWKFFKKSSDTVTTPIFMKFIQNVLFLFFFQGFRSSRQDAANNDNAPLDIGTIAAAGERCVDKVVMVQETEYDGMNEINIPNPKIKMFQKNASKFVILLEYKSPHSFFILCYFNIFLNECPGLCRHRPDHSLGRKLK